MGPEMTATVHQIEELLQKEKNKWWKIWFVIEKAFPIQTGYSQSKERCCNGNIR
jgi:hypothetical protein